MKILIYSAVLLCTIVLGCHSPGRPKQEDIDPRPKDQIDFLSRIKGEMSSLIRNDVMKKDEHAKAFNQFFQDSVKEINNWQVIVKDINDEIPNVSHAVFPEFAGQPVYNLLLSAPFDRKDEDPMRSLNRLDLMCTILKETTDETDKKSLAVFKTLEKGDTVIVSGRLAHYDENAKINFAPFYEDFAPWEIDIYLKDIRKKAAK